MHITNLLFCILGGLFIGLELWLFAGLKNDDFLYLMIFGLTIGLLFLM